MPEAHLGNASIIDPPMIRATFRDLDRQYGFVWGDTIKAVAKLLAGTTAGAVFGAATPAFLTSLMEGGVSLIPALQGQTSVEGRAFDLVRRSLGLAWATIAAGTLKAHGISLPTPDAVVTSLDATIASEVLELRSTFLDRPAELPLLPRVKEALAGWLEGFGVRPQLAVEAAAELPAAFVGALRYIHASAPVNYAPLADRFATPFDLADERERGWLSYRGFLEAELHRPLFGDTSSLADVYQPPRAYSVLEEPVPGEDADSAETLFTGSSIPRKRRRVHVVCDLRTEFDRWLHTAGKDDNLRVVCGGPGSGKSSFAKFWTAELTKRRDPPVLLVPLHHFECGDSLERAINDHARSGGLLRHEPLDRSIGDERLLLFLDGLDELVMQGKRGRDAAEELVDRIRRLLSVRNAAGLSLQAVVGGRELLVDALEGKFDRREVFHLLPYYVPRGNKVIEVKTEVYLGLWRRSETESKEEWEAADSRHIWRDSANLLAVDQRDRWWQSWGEIRGHISFLMPISLKNNRHLNALTTQPLLNHIVAIARTGAEANIDAAERINAVYARLLEHVHERSWGERKLPEHERLEFGEFARVFEAIALAAWQSGDARTVSSAAVAAAVEQEGLRPKLEGFERSAERGAVSLLTAFYFRAAGRSRESRIWEFTHKQFGEYLVARHFVRAIEELDQQREDRRRHPRKGWDETAALAYWVGLMGASALDMDLVDLIRGEAARADVEQRKAWQRTLTELLSFALAHGLPMDVAEQRQGERRERWSFSEMCRRARNATEALLVAVNACARLTADASKKSGERAGYSVCWPGLVIEGEPSVGATVGCAAELIQHLRGQRLKVDQSCVVLRSLSYLDLHRQDLRLQDLSLAELRGADLRWTKLQGADLSGADLQGADLRGANLSGANLSGANLHGAALGAANLTGAIREGSTLQPKDLNCTSLDESEFIGGMHED